MSTSIIVAVVSVLASIAPTTHAAEQDLWKLTDVTVMAFDAKNVTLESASDNRGIFLYFKKWTPDAEQNFSRTLKNTSITYRVHHLRQSTATVELYSQNGNLRFNQKVRQNTIQVILGNERAELYPIKKILDKDILVHIAPEIEADLRNGILNQARRKLLISVTPKPHEQTLIRNRVALINAAVRGGKPLECEPSFTLSTGTMQLEDIESLILNATCNFLLGKTTRAARSLRHIQSTVEDPKIIRRVKALEYEFLAASILEESRRENHEVLAAMFLESIKYFTQNLFSYQIMESISDSLKKLGLSQLAIPYADLIIAGLSNEELKYVIPIMAEFYLAAGNEIKALDAASYFLEQRIPLWVRARLLKVVSKVEMQNGNWRGALQHLEEVHSIAGLTFPEQVLQMEAYIRLGMKPPVIVKLPIKKNKEHLPYYKWLGRLNNELALYSEPRLNDAQLEKLPDYALYKGLLKAKEDKNTMRVRRLAKELITREGAFSRLAESELNIDSFNRQLKKIENGEML